MTFIAVVAICEYVPDVPVFLSIAKLSSLLELSCQIKAIWTGAVCVDELTVKPNAVVFVTPPPVAVTVIVKLPVGVEALVVTVKVEEQLGLQLAEENEAVVPGGSPAAEKVTVRSSTELINTQNATVSSTLNADQLNRMPTASRNALNAVTFLPGVNTTSSNRGSTVNGLPESMLNITLDGVSNQDNFLKSSDGFFASVYPRQDAVEAVTVTSAVAGAKSQAPVAISRSSCPPVQPA